MKLLPIQVKLSPIVRISRSTANISSQKSGTLKTNGPLDGTTFCQLARLLNSTGRSKKDFLTALGKYSFSVSPFFAICLLKCSMEAKEYFDASWHVIFFTYSWIFFKLKRW